MVFDACEYRVVGGCGWHFELCTHTMACRNLTYADMNYLKTPQCIMRHPDMARAGTVITADDTHDIELVGCVLFAACVRVHADKLVDGYQRSLYSTVHHMKKENVEAELRSLGHLHNCITVLSPEQNFGIAIKRMDGESVADLRSVASPFSNHLDRQYHIVWRRKSGLYAKLPVVIQKDLLVDGRGLSLEDEPGKTCISANFFVDDGVIYPFVDRAVWDAVLSSKESKKRISNAFARTDIAGEFYFSTRAVDTSSSSSTADIISGSAKPSGENANTQKSNFARKQTTLTSAFKRQQLHSSQHPSSTSASPTRDISIAMEEEVMCDGVTYTKHLDGDDDNMWYDDAEEAKWYMRKDDGSFVPHPKYYGAEDEESDGAEDDVVTVTYDGRVYTCDTTQDNMWYDDNEIWFKRNDDGGFSKRTEFYDDDEEEEEEEDEDAGTKKVMAFIEGLEREADDDYDPNHEDDDMDVSDAAAEAEDAAIPAESDDDDGIVEALLHDIEDMDKDRTFDEELGRYLTREEEEERLEEEAGEFMVSDSEALREVHAVEEKQRRKDAKRKAKAKAKAKKIAAKHKTEPKKKVVTKRLKKPVITEASESDSSPFTSESDSDGSDSSSSSSSSSSDGEDTLESQAFKMANVELKRGPQRSAHRQSVLKDKRRSIAEEKKRLRDLEREVEDKRREVAESTSTNKAAAKKKKKRELATQKTKAKAASSKPRSKASASRKANDKFYLRLAGMDRTQAMRAQADFQEELKSTDDRIGELSDEEKRDLCLAIFSTCNTAQLSAMRTFLELFADYGPRIPYTSKAPKSGKDSEEDKVRLQAGLCLLGGSRVSVCKHPVSKGMRKYQLDVFSLPEFLRDRITDN